MDFTYQPVERYRAIMALLLCVLQYKSSENTVGKGEIACNRQFLLFPQCFILFLERFMSFSSNLKLLSAPSFSLEKSKNLSFGKGLKTRDERGMNPVITSFIEPSCNEFRKFSVRDWPNLASSPLIQLRYKA